MPERAPQRGNGNPGAATCRLGNRVIGNQFAIRIGRPKDVLGHPVFGATREIVMLSFRKNYAMLTFPF